jgi:signal transduction histidine kinase/CheY-like chemotaxis protein/GAF domain-containing protein
MILAPPHPAESDRMNVLRGLGILDTAPDPAFDDITRLAAELLDVPIALVSLVDADRQWFKSRRGSAMHETPRDHAFCAHAIVQDALFEVRDARADRRFHDNPLVTGEPHVRFYAGMPLRIDGQPVGTLCVIDREPRRLDSRQRSMLERLAGMVERALVHHRQLSSAMQTDRRLHDFLAASGDWFWESDGLRIRWVSDNVGRVLGVDPPEYVGHLVSEGLVSDLAETRAANAAALASIRAQRAFRDLTVRCSVPGGERIVVKSGVPILGVDGRFVGFRGVARDATDSRAIRGAARAAEVRLHEAIDALEQPVVMTDADGRIVLTNARWRAHSLRPGEAVPATWEEAMRRIVDGGKVGSAIGKEAERIAARLAARGHSTESFEFSVNGVDFIGRDVRLSDGGCLTVSSDVSSIKADQRAAQDAARRLQLAVSATGLLVSEANLDTDDCVPVGGVGSPLQTTAALPHPRTVTEWLAAICDADRDRVAASLRELWDGGCTSVRDEYLTERGGRTVRIVLEAMMVPPEAGRPRRLLGVTRDVTELRAAEKAAREKGTADLANRAKSEFLSRVGHELRTPLNAIRGLAQVLARDTTNEPAESRKPLLDHIVTASQHLGALLDDLLDMSQIESGRLAIRAESVPVAGVLRESVRMIAPEAAGHGISLDFGRVPEGLQVHADPTRLRQILLNLASNAVKYNRPRGSVRFEANAETLEGYVSISVSDTGEGLSRDEVGRLFRPFERLSRSEALSSDGLGLGLSIAQRLAQLMGGSIEVDSVRGQGTTFTVHLPLAVTPRLEDRSPVGSQRFGPAEDPFDGLPPAEVRDESGRTHRSRMPPRRVLYVEDNRLNAVLMKQIGRQVPGLTLRVVESGEEALAQLDEFDPDLLLLDNDLPGASGLDVHAALRADPRHASLRIVLVSADATAESIARARDLGFDDYWVKPLDVEHVIVALGGPAAVTAA